MAGTSFAASHQFMQAQTKLSNHAQRAGMTFALTPFQLMFANVVALVFQQIEERPNEKPTS
jgi:hypothetical protein